MNRLLGFRMCLLRGKAIALTMARRLRLEAKRIGFKAEPTVIVAVAALAYMLPPYLNSARFRMLLNRVGGQAFSADGAGAWPGIVAMIHVLLPALFILATKGRLREYGLGLGNVKTGLKICAVFYGLYIPCFLVLLLSESFRDYYASSAAIHAAQAGSLSRHLLSVLALMIGSEFLWRGFLLLGMKKHYGPYPAILIHLLPYVCLHMDKPAIEVIGSFPVGLALGYLVIRTRSIWYGVLLHASLGISLLLAAILLKT